MASNGTPQSLLYQMRGRSTNDYGRNRSAEQYNTNSGNPNMPMFNYNQGSGYGDLYNQYFYGANNTPSGGQRSELGRYLPPMLNHFSTDPIARDQGGYSFNVPNSFGPYIGAYGSGQPAMTQYGVMGSGFMPQPGMFQGYNGMGGGNGMGGNPYITGGNGQPVAGRMPPQGGQYPQQGGQDPTRQKYMNDQPAMDNFRNVFGGQNTGYLNQMLGSMFGGNGRVPVDRGGPSFQGINPAKPGLPQTVGNMPPMDTQPVSDGFMPIKPGGAVTGNFNPTSGSVANPTNPYQNYNLPPMFRYF